MPRDYFLGSRRKHCTNSLSHLDIQLSFAAIYPVQELPTVSIPQNSEMHMRLFMSQSSAVHINHASTSPAALPHAQP
jgi:hypothetical protein